MPIRNWRCVLAHSCSPLPIRLTKTFEPPAKAADAPAEAALDSFIFKFTDWNVRTFLCTEKNFYMYTLFTSEPENPLG